MADYGHIYRQELHLTLSAIRVNGTTSRQY
jgi:hypothetical protein